MGFVFMMGVDPEDPGVGGRNELFIGDSVTFGGYVLLSIISIGRRLF